MFSGIASPVMLSYNLTKQSVLGGRTNKMLTFWKNLRFPMRYNDTVNSKLDFGTEHYSFSFISSLHLPAINTARHSLNCLIILLFSVIPSSLHLTLTSFPLTAASHSYVSGETVYPMSVKYALCLIKLFY